MNILEMQSLLAELEIYTGINYNVCNAAYVNKPGEPIRVFIKGALSKEEFEEVSKEILDFHRSLPWGNRLFPFTHYFWPLLAATA